MYLNLSLIRIWPETHLSITHKSNNQISDYTHVILFSSLTSRNTKLFVFACIKQKHFVLVQFFKYTVMSTLSFDWYIFFKTSELKKYQNM